MYLYKNYYICTQTNWTTYTSEHSNSPLLTFIKQEQTMSKWLTYGVLCVMLCTVGCGGKHTGLEDKQTDADSSESIGKAKIKSIHEECWNFSRGSYGELSYKETIEYHENGLEKSLRIKYGNGTSSVTTFIYKDGRLATRKQTMTDGQSFSICYAYDDNGRVKQISDASRNNPIERYEYNEKGQITWKYSYDGESDNPLYANHYEYDKDGHLSLETQYNENGEELLEKHTLLYGEDGLLHKEEFLGRFDGDISITYEYTDFDDEGNWTICIKREIHDDGNEYKSETVRKYIYY